METSIEHIGNELVEYSKQAELFPRSLTSELFPYIYDASKRLSARAISRWLSDEKNIQLSQVSISKSLREKEKNFESHADFIEVVAERFGDIFDVSTEDVLFNETAFDVNCHQKPKLPAANLDEYQEIESVGSNASEILSNNWWNLSSGFRANCRPYFSFSQNEDAPNE